ncbi:MAG TPA: nucleotidyltransferase domain-containing protein [Thermomicrobiales bacterium]|nr:nucleotidyltransferase domain-containing protein [Thermomicrobiales bacterium]
MSISREQPRLTAAAQDVARTVAGVAHERGAVASILTGSFARGDAHPESDLDLHFIGDGPDYELSRVDGLLVSQSWSLAAAHRAGFRDPGRAGAAVPAWRGALILLDPDNFARELQQEATRWTWDVIGDDTLNAWVAGQITGYAEEIHKLVVAIERGRTTTAGIQRSILALRLGVVMSVNCRLLYDSENRLWDMVGEALGGAWASAQARALGSRGESFDETCAAALELYGHAVDASPARFSVTQHDVIQHARDIADAAAARLLASGRRSHGR